MNDYHDWMPEINVDHSWGVADHVSTVVVQANSRKRRSCFMIRGMIEWDFMPLCVMMNLLQSRSMIDDS